MITKGWNKCKKLAAEAFPLSDGGPEESLSSDDNSSGNFSSISKNGWTHDIDDDDISSRDFSSVCTSTRAPLWVRIL